MPEYGTLTSTETLVAMAQRGDAAAAEALLRRHDAMLRAVARLWFVPGCDDEDLLQETRIAFWQAIRDFDGSRGSHFGCYARDKIHWHMANLVRRARCACRDGGYGAASLEELTAAGSHAAETTCGGTEQVIHDLEARDLCEDLWRRVRSVLSPTEREVVLSRAAGQSYEEIAKRLGIDRKAVDNALRRARQKAAPLREWFERQMAG
jgi:RNA polymerase sporulation-specific sigma factor